MTWGIYLEGKLVKLSSLQPFKKTILEKKLGSFN